MVTNQEAYKQYYASRSGTTYTGKELTVSSGTSPSSLQQRTQAQQDLANLTTQQDYYFAHSPRPVLENGKLVLSNRPGLFDSTGGQVFSPSTKGGLYYDLEKDPTMYYGGLSPSGRELLVRQLVASGFLDRNDVGDFMAEITAVEKAMYFSNVYGLEITNAMSQRAAAGGFKTTRTGAVRSYSMTSPEDLKAYLKSVASNTIGRELTDQEAAGFIQQYQQQEVAYQKAVYSGGAAVQPPSVDVAATNYIQNMLPKEESAYRYLGYMNMLFDSVGSV